MKTAILFAGRNGLDWCELRQAVLRIPEVSIRIAETQQLFDQMDIPAMDFRSYIASEDDVYTRNIKLKSLAAAVVQVGLWDRFTKYNRKPDYMVGNSNGDSALAVACGRLAFAELVVQSPALLTLKPIEKAAAVSPLDEKAQQIKRAASLEAPILAGMSLTEYEAVKCDGSQARHGFMDFRKLILIMKEEEGVGQFINVGPAQPLLHRDMKDIASRDIEVSDSIEMDPLLSWFWSNLKPEKRQFAQ